MKSSSRDHKSRDDITETVNQSETELDEKAVDLNKVTQDVETVRDTLIGLEFGGSAEGSDAVQQAMESAEDVTAKNFDRQDEKLDETQNENAEFEQELQGVTESERSDIEKLSEASGQIETQDTNNQLLKAKEAGLQDVDYLMAQIDRAKAARDKSEAAQQEYQQIVRRQGGWRHE